MDTQKILQADVLDILFDNRNKSYGAYELRKNYHKRLRNALMISTTLLFVTVAIPTIANMFEKPLQFTEPKVITVMHEVDLSKDPIVKPEEPTIKTPQHTEDVSTVKNTIPKIVKSIEVEKEDELPTTDDFKDHTSSNQNHEGTVEHTTDANPTPTIETGNGKAITPDPIVEDNTPMEIETLEQLPEYPGGDEELLNYLSKNINYPNQAIEHDIEGRVIVSFIITKNGDIDEMKIIKGIGYGCDDEAKRVLRNMPKWKPGKNNGHAVNVFYNLPITFSINH